MSVVVGDKALADDVAARAVVGGNNTRPHGPGCLLGAVFGGFWAL